MIDLHHLSVFAEVPLSGLGQETMDCLSQFYRCPEGSIRFAPRVSSSAETGYFRFGDETICHGFLQGGRAAKSPKGVLYDALRDVEVKDGTLHLPFEPSQVIENLRCERYTSDWRHDEPMSALARAYYFIRPILPVGVRRHLQKLYLRGWEKIPFPRWPVDTSVDDLLWKLMLLAIRSGEVKRVPFIWFWPDGAPSAAIMTHDVETTAGRDFCVPLMDIDESFGIKASFQVVPEERYAVERNFLSSIRDRGFEVVIHDLNHDGHLYRTREQFLERAEKINAYGKQYGADGFRAGVLYRKQIWYDALDFAYDMSVPNVAHLDPQRGGCCTVMPYFIGDILELPVTTTQDYSLFNILHEYSIDLWIRQMDLIMEKHGLMSFIVHPDYLVTAQQRGVYEQLLNHLRGLDREKGVWLSTSGEVNRWWRQRDQMTWVSDENGWHIDGPGSDRACIAYASERDGRLSFSLETASTAR
jgi:hypothetical protein